MVVMGTLLFELKNEIKKIFFLKVGLVWLMEFYNKDWFYWLVQVVDFFCSFCIFSELQGHGENILKSIVKRAIF